MPETCSIPSAALAGILVLCAGMACAQDPSTGSGQAPSAGSGQAFPNKPVHLVTGTAGGALDFTARLIAPGLTKGLGQQVIVDNRAGLLIGALVAKAPPDGHTLLVQSNALWILAFLEKAPYDPARDFGPVTVMTRQFNVLVAHPSLRVKTVKDLIALAKARPGELNYASAATGTTSHISAEIFKSMAGVNIVRIPYKGGGQAFGDVLSGQVPLMFAPIAPIAPHVKSGRLNALGVTSAQTSPLVPGVPTIASQGLPGFESVSMYGLFAPAKTPAAVINRLHQEVVRVLSLPDVREKFSATDVDVVGNSPTEFAAAIKTDMVRVGNVLKDAGARAD